MRRIDPTVVVLLAGISAALHIGKLPPALPVLRDALQVSLVQAGFLLSIVQLAGMTLGLAMGAAADSIGPRRTMVLGCLILAIASFLGGAARTPEALLALRAAEGAGFLLASLPAPGLIRRLVDLQLLGAGDTALPHAARHHRRVAGHPAAGGEDCLGRHHAVEVVRAGLAPHQDHLLSLAGALDSGIGVEHDAAHGRAR